MEQSSNVIPINIEEEMKVSFLDYSMSVIVSRALPDVRDGLKPVHRRILYAMYQLKNFYNRPYLKSARIVGDVIGRFHPHGDSSVYEALVRMAQDFSMRYPLVQGQGNFGSVDGDKAAAMRYTEVRLQQVTDLIMADIEKETVNFIPNYDNKEMEPQVLPTKLPTLLINGANGIAVGMATNIPPHNLGEVIDATLALIEDPDTDLGQITQHIQGPDFPTGGIIHGMAGIQQAYTTGKGSVVMRAKAHVEDLPRQTNRERIIVSELPFQVNKAKLIEKIADLIRDKSVEGISDIRDESVQEDVRVVIELKRGESGEVILNQLYKHTPLQSSFGVNMVALVSGIPKLLNLKVVLEQFILHRQEVIIRRTAYELRKAEERAHILLGLKTAVENADDVVELIRKSPDSPTAHQQLKQKFDLSDVQAKAILDMRLARLTGLEREKIVKEHNEIIEKIDDLKGILDSEDRVTQIIKDDLVQLKEDYGDERRTEIVASDADEFSMESLVADEEVVVTVSHAGYIKRTPLDQINAQKRGGKGRKGMATKSEDIVQNLFISSNHQSLLCFTDSGRVYEMKVYRIPESALAGRGKHFANLLKLNGEEKIVSVVPVKQFEEGSYIVCATANGYIKKTDLMAFSNLRKTGIVGLKLDDGDRLVGSAIVRENNTLLLATRLGKAIRFKGEDIRPMGRSARGVTGIRFSEETDRVIGLEVVDGDGAVLSVCENGYGKRTAIEDYRIQSRGGKGIYTIKVTERNGPVIGILQVDAEDHIMVMTTSGKVMRSSVAEVGVVGRFTQGVRIMHVESGEKVIGVAKVAQIEGEDV